MSEFETNMNIICLESKAFKALVREVVDQIKKEEIFQSDPWVNEEEAMKILDVSSKNTLQKYRDEGGIDHRRVSTKKIFYRRQSLYDFIENSPKTS